MDIRLLAIAMLFACWAVAAVAQSTPTPAEKSAMERAQREADGPRRRILEAAKVKGTVKTPEPATPTPPPPVQAAAPAVVPAAAVASKPAPKEDAPPERMLVTQPGAVAPVALPASGVSQVPTLAKVEVAPAAVSLVALPQAPKAAEPLGLPKLVSRVDPELPARLLRRISSRRTELTVELTIQPDGSVSDVAVRTPTDDEVIDLVRDALRQWRYEPQPSVRAHTVQLVFGQG